MLETLLDSAQGCSRASRSADLASTLEQVRADRKRDLDRAGIALALPGDAPPLAVLPADLYRLVSNLVGNAIEHMGAAADAEIRVTVQCDGPWATLRVSDNGDGIAPERHERVFDVAYSGQGRSSERRHCGLGLAIVRELAERWGGRAWVDSSPAPGATLCVTLPIVRGA